MRAQVLTTMRSIRDPATDELRDSISRDWTAFLEKVDCDTYPIANGLQDPSRLLQRLEPDALLLTNGEDVGSHPPRDQTESSLVDYALSHEIPVLGVCRGHQFLNNYFDGTLVDLAHHLSNHHGHAGTVHPVNVVEGPLRQSLPSTLQVNSYHDQGIIMDGIAPELEPAAFSDNDQIVESLYHPDLPILTMQWHPERPIPESEPINTLVREFLTGKLQW